MPGDRFADRGGRLATLAGRPPEVSAAISSFEVGGPIQASWLARDSSLPLIALGAAFALPAFATAQDVAPRGAAVPPIKHVFIIVLENENFEASFGPTSAAPVPLAGAPGAGRLPAELLRDRAPQQARTTSR